MILDETIKIKVNSSQLKHLRSLNYNVNTGDELDLPVKDLNYGSNIKINCQCDVCGTIKKHPYRRYLKSSKNSGFYACSSKCAKEKTKKTFINKYGVDHHFQTKETKDKIKSTWKEKYGVEHYSHSSNYINKKNDIIKKRKNTIYVKYKEKEKLISIDDDNIIKYCYDHDGEYSIDKKLYHNRVQSKIETCTVCFPFKENVSIKEIELFNFISKNTNNKILQNYKIDNNEIDVFIPELNLGFEFNGLYWHSELHRSNDYHLNKTKYMLNKGIKLIHIWEDDWDQKKEIVKSRIINLLGGNTNKIYARKCVINEVESKIYKKFLQVNHIQGSVNSRIKIGLYYNGVLVSVMGFGSLRRSLGYKNKENHYEMLRFCNKLNTSVVGGASKLFNHFIDKWGPKSIISYADRSWSNGELYHMLGFTLVNNTKPNYYYLINKKRVNRYNYRKDRLVKEGFDANKTEKEIMLERKLYRLYDSGSLLFRYD